jgi:hypothetical protein
LLERIVGYDIPTYTENQKLSVKIGDHLHGAETLGLGIISLFHLINAIHDAPEGSIVLIDEPEIGLHPSFQRRVFELLREEAAKLQIIYATQSPYMVDWDAILDGASLARVYRQLGGYSRIDALKPQTARELACLEEDSNNPHVLGTNAREVFFLEDRIILVEGQEDVVFYRKMAKNLGIDLVGDFYGWGVGGATKMARVAAVLRDLGYTHVTGVLDADKSAVRSELEKQFPRYTFVSISTNDVRDRNASSRPSAEGLCKGSGIVHEKHVGEVKMLFATINTALTKAS